MRLEVGELVGDLLGDCGDVCGCELVVVDDCLGEGFGCYDLVCGGLSIHSDELI